MANLYIPTGSHLARRAETLRNGGAPPRTLFSYVVDDDLLLLPDEPELHEQCVPLMVEPLAMKTGDRGLRRRH